MICMLELGQLEKEHAEFDKRKSRVIVVSLENQEDAKATQADFPHLVVVADTEKKLSTALGVIHAGQAPDGGDTTMPTSILVDGNGLVRWVMRPDNMFVRHTPAHVLADIDAHVK